MYPQELKSGTQKYTGTHVFIVALFMKGPGRNSTKVHPRMERIHCGLYILMEDYSFIKRTEVSDTPYNIDEP